MSIKTVNSLSHYTDWTIAHVHGGALGWNGFLTFSMLYWLFPRLYRTKLWSTKLANYHFWIGLLGMVFYVIPIYVAGITEGLDVETIQQGRLPAISELSGNHRAGGADVPAARDRRHALSRRRVLDGLQPVSHGQGRPI